MAGAGPRGLGPDASPDLPESLFINPRCALPDVSVGDVVGAALSGGLMNCMRPRGGQPRSMCNSRFDRLGQHEEAVGREPGGPLDAFVGVTSAGESGRDQCYDRRRRSGGGVAEWQTLGT